MADELPEWERLLAAAARLQGILPDATLVGGTAAAIDAGHRRSMDADHVISGLSGRFDDVLAELESAIASMLTDHAVLAALAPMDDLYPQPASRGAVRQQLMLQLAMPRPFDLDGLDLAEYKELSAVWRDWETVVGQCRRVGTLMASAVATQRAGWQDVKG